MQAQQRRIYLATVPLDVHPSVNSATEELILRMESGSPFLATFVNPSIYAALSRNAKLESDLQRFDYIFSDGIGLTLAAQFIEKRRNARISFDSTSLALPILGAAARLNLRVALVGGQCGVANRASNQLRSIFPELQLSVIADGYAGLQDTAKRVSDSGSDLIICGMGTGPQERFLCGMADIGWRGFGFTCGGYLDQLSNGTIYYPKLVDKLNVRAVYRLYREPKRLWRRYLIDYPKCGAILVRHIVLNTLRSKTLLRGTSAAIRSLHDKN
jgi:N-acetylglucosaminyldiphosphoundecaprenol N-acetyl-beta-D-mannosaminyltransferase